LQPAQMASFEVFCSSETFKKCLILYLLTSGIVIELFCKQMKMN